MEKNVLSVILSVRTVTQFISGEKNLINVKDIRV